ncbi:MAG: hypothetical protein AAGH15_20690 [Myxococcota bacterium]
MAEAARRPIVRGMIPGAPLDGVLGGRGDAAGLGDVPPALWVPTLEGGTRRDLAARLRDELRRLPTPIRPQGPRHTARLLLEEVLGWIELFESGDAERLLRVERSRWLSGGDVVRYCEQLRRFGDEEMAEALARTVVGREPGIAPRLRERLEAFLAAGDPLPGSLHRAIDRLGAEPSLDAMRALLRFTPEELRPTRLRRVIEVLEEAGVGADERFRLAAVLGPSAEALRLAESGAVAPATIEALAGGADDPGPWLGIAARAACVRGDRLGTVRLLRGALAAGALARGDLAFIRHHGDAELRTMLERAGVPRSV